MAWSAPPARSALFVPANRAEMLDKARGFGPDIVLADLEDSVPVAEKATARRVLQQWLDALTDEYAPHVAVRINSLSEGVADDDVAVCVHPRVSTVMVPKVEGAADVDQVAAALERHEQGAGRTRVLSVWPVIETAAAVRNAYDIAVASDRVAYMGGIAADGGDLARSIGFHWTPSFLETLFVRSKVLVDARAAGIANPMTGLVTRIGDLDEVAAFAAQSRDLGYAGMMVIHPSHVAVVNATFGVTPERLAWARNLLAALDAGATSGSGAVRFEGAMVDAAMEQTARDIVRQAEAFSG
jgi:citrate lyase subunit beta/citryl-CoA lyase